MKESKRTCFKCGRSAAEPDVVLYRFPRPGVRNTVRCELWAKFVFPNGPWHSTEFQQKLFSEHRMLCNNHFEITSFSDFSQKKLFRDAAPKETSDEVNAASQPVDLSEPGPSQVVLSDITNSKNNTACSISTNVNAASQTVDLSEPGPSQSQVVLSDITNSKNNTAVSISTNIVTDAGKENYLPCKEHNYSLPLPCESSIPTPKTSSSSQPKRKRRKSASPDSLQKRPKKGDQIHAESSSGSSSEKRQNTTNILHNIKTDKEKKYYLKSRKYFKRICQLRNTIKKYKTQDQLRILSTDDTIKNLQKTLSPVFSMLLQAQIKNFTKAPKGRRWTTEEKILALRIYKRSPTCYRLLSRMFCLPAPSSIKNLLTRFDLTPGINKNILTPLKKLAEKQKPSENKYILMFDEMSIKKHLSYNKKHDVIEGYQDHGEHGRIPQEAGKALVFMIAGIRKAVKQPLAYYLSGANVTADRLSVIIKQTIRECYNAGIEVSATVCDMGGTNRRALALLGATEQQPTIKIDAKEVVALFDAPHLLKCFRNMFLKYDIKCQTNISSSGMSGEGLARWSDIKNFYTIDNNNPNFVFAPTLKKEHLEPNTKEKMKVNLAAQVLSHTVAAGIFAKVSEGKMPASAAVTADVLSNMDKLFDLVNSDTSDCRNGKPYATNISKTSPHAEHFKKMKLFFKNITFIGCPRPPPSLEGWVWTINGLEALWNKFQKHGDVQSLSTRRLQQDPLENLFGCIRGNCGSNTNPTTSGFVGGIKTAIMSNLAHISSGNCERDDNLTMITNYKTLLSKCDPQPTNICKTPLLPLFESIVDIDMIEATPGEDSGELQACAYVCGFLIKNQKNKNCPQCKQILETDEPTSIHNFVENKEYFNLKKCLKYSSPQFVSAVESCAVVINKMLAEDASKRNIKKLVLNRIDSRMFDFLKRCSVHYEVNMNYIKTSVFHICINRFCVLQNRKYTEEASKAALKKKVTILKNL